ncbi:hypothetical protein B0H15DRAFT_1028150 [Mycena belliarum]|uniref:Uncharacterized protein n=1 Tax=Mycena belliarum TaxID=1033014 RepID=A0AAD6TLB3_9AGAR|nr:hypothetical protein B0H15DRAFT_1028150 [Mycena belliae]
MDTPAQDRTASKPGSMIASVRMPMSSSSHTSAANDRVVSSWRRSTSENGGEQGPGQSRRGQEVVCSMQLRAARMIVGGMVSSPGDMLDAHADPPPMHLAIDHHLQKAALRCLTLCDTPSHAPFTFGGQKMRANDM